MISIVLLFDYKSIYNELQNNVDAISKDVVAIYCRDVCDNIMKQIQQAGFTSVIISCSEFTKQIADPMVIKIDVRIVNNNIIIIIAI